MTAFELRFEDPSKSSADPARTFFWTTSNASTIDARLVHDGRIGPRLGALGPVNEANIDLVRIAVAVFAADRSTPRKVGRADWVRRAISVTVPVLNPARWQSVAAPLKAVMDFLSGDDWDLQLVSGQTPHEDVAEVEGSQSRVVLLSGGADSAIGALRSRHDLASDGAHTLVSHYSSTLLPTLQHGIADRIESLLPGPDQTHIRAKMARAGKTAAGTGFRDEPTQRSRSLLFLALGLAVASIDGVPVWIPENGFAALNPPLGPERLGSVSTRTTHPAFLSGLSQVVTQAGAHADIVNPFALMTKGEMFRWAADTVGDQQASDLLSETNSCAHTGQRTFGVSTAQPCGVCFGCVVRRVSFMASGLQDQTVYADGSGSPELARWLESKSIEDAVRRFVDHGITDRDLIGMGLPDDYSLADARDLCRRGLAELALL